MPNLSEKELSGIHDILSAEELLVKKFNLLAGMTGDTAIQKRLNSIAGVHQKHINMLYQQLG